MTISRNTSNNQILELLNAITHGNFQLAEEKSEELTFVAQTEGVVEDMLGNVMRTEKFVDFLKNHEQSGNFKMEFQTTYRGDDRYMQCEKFPILKVKNYSQFFGILVKENESQKKSEEKQGMSAILSARCQASSRGLSAGSRERSL